MARGNVSHVTFPYQNYRRRTVPHI